MCDNPFRRSPGLCLPPVGGRALTRLSRIVGGLGDPGQSSEHKSREQQVCSMSNQGTVGTPGRGCAKSGSVKGRNAVVELTSHKIQWVTEANSLKRSPKPSGADEDKAFALY